MLRLFCGLLIVGVMAVSAFAAEPPVPRPLIEKALRVSHCELSYEDATADLDSPKSLGDNLKLVEIPCWHEKYQSASIFFAVDPVSPGEARLLQFRYPKVRGFEHRHSVTSADYHAKTKLMTSLERRRKTRDCGGAGEWKWSGSSFVLKRYWLKVDCNGRRFNPHRHPKRWQIFPKEHKR